MSLEIKAEWERLDSGAPEERASFAALGIFAEGLCLTEAEDLFVKRIRQSVHLSAYSLAEWLAWNWWRLRWEPRVARRTDWAFAHRMSTIGGGYVWPNVTVLSDGERVALFARPTKPRPAEPLRYLADQAVVVSAAAFETGVDSFVEQVRGQLRMEALSTTNLDEVWEEVRAERGEPDSRRWRQLEAFLGYDPGEAPAGELEQLIADMAVLGEQATREMAAARPEGHQALSAQALRELARTHGLQLDPASAVRLARPERFRPSADEPAWRRGRDAARALREQERLGHEPLANLQLTELAGVSEAALTEDGAAQLSFALDEDAAPSSIVLRRTPWQTSRRFDLARLLGDRLVCAHHDHLFPATQANTYRQKWQRAFAAELLCPHDALVEMLAGDLSDEAIEGAAQHFDVSELAVRTILVNNRLLTPESLESVAATA